MRNFNTNQTRRFYVANAIVAVGDGETAGANVAAAGVANCSIALGTTETGELFFAYKNADGIVTRSDTFRKDRIKSLKKTAAAAMATKLLAHTVKASAATLTALSSLVGKTLNLIITIHGVHDYDMDNTLSFNAAVTLDSTNTANAAAFHQALALAIAKAVPVFDKGYPLVRVFSNGTEVNATDELADVTGSANGVVLVEGPQKYVRGKLSGEACPFSVAFQLEGSDEPWGEDSIALVPNAISMKTIPANYVLADLEYFAAGEHGDYYRGALWPNEYTPTYAIDPNSNTAYDILSIEYYWAGNAENVQKSPRLIQVAGASADIATLYSAIVAAMA